MITAALISLHLIDSHFIADRDRTAVKHASEHTFSGPDAVVHLFVDLAAGMTFFTDLGQFQHNIIAVSWQRTCPTACFVSISFMYYPFSANIWMVPRSGIVSAAPQLKLRSPLDSFLRLVSRSEE